MNKATVWVLIVSFGGLSIVVTVPSSPEPPPAPVRVSEERIRSRSAFAADIAAAVQAYHDRNREAYWMAVSQATKFLEDKTEEGTPEFIQDVTRLRTQLRIARESVGDTVANLRGRDCAGDRMDAFYQERFETHYFSEEQLAEVLEDIIFEFTERLHANRNRLYAAVSAGMEEHRMEEDGICSRWIEAQQTRAVDRLVQEIGKDLNRRQFLRTLVNFADFNMIRRKFQVHALLQPILRKSALQNASRVVTLSGATAKGAAGGAAAGTAVKPGLGTIVFSAGGIAAGIAIDAYMAKQIEERLETDMHQMLDQYRYGVLYGTDEDTPGLSVLMRSMLQDMETADLDVLNAALNHTGISKENIVTPSIYQIRRNQEFLAAFLKSEKNSEPQQSGTVAGVLPIFSGRNR